jgi:hypothetical protein
MKFISIILFGLLLGGCSNSSPFLPEKPANLLSEGKFKNILSEMIVTEILVQSKISSPKEVNKEMNRLGNEILKNHAIDSTQYAKSFDYYAANKDIMEKIYNDLITDFNKKIEKLN